MFQRVLLTLSVLAVMSTTAFANNDQFFHFSTKEAFIDHALSGMGKSKPSNPFRQTLIKRDLSQQMESYQCDLFGQSQPLAAMDQSLSELTQAFQSEPECQPYQADVKKVTETAESLKNGFGSIISALEGGVSDADQIAQLQSQTLQMIQQTQTVLGLLVPIAKGQVFSKQCQQKLYTKSHLVQSVSSWALNLTPVILKVASLFPGGQMVGNLIAGATTLVAGTLNSFATQDLEGRVDMSVPQNRINTMNNVCQFFMVSKRFSSMTMASGVNKDVLEQSLNIYIATLLKQADQIDAQSIQQLRSYWDFAKLLQSTKQNVSALKYAVPQNSSFTQCVLGATSNLNGLSQQIQMVSEKLSAVQASLSSAQISDEGFFSIYDIHQFESLTAQFLAQMNQIKQQVTAKTLSAQTAQAQCMDLNNTFAADLESLKNEFASFLSLMMENLSHRIGADQKMNDQFKMVSQIWDQVNDIKAEVALLQSQASQTSSALKAEMNDRMNKLKYRLLADTKSPVHDLILFLSNRYRINKNEMMSLVSSLRDQLAQLMSQGKLSLGNAGGNIIANQSQSYATNSNLNLLDSAAVTNHPQVKALICNNVKSILIRYQGLIDETANIENVCGYVHSDLDLNSKRELREACLGRYTGQQGQVVATAPLFEQLSFQTNSAPTPEGMNFESAIGLMQNKFLALNCGVF